MSNSTSEQKLTGLQSCHFKLVVNDYKEAEKYFDRLKESQLCKYIVWQEEKAPTTGKLHLDCHVVTAKRGSVRWFLKTIAVWLDGHPHIEIARSPGASMNYSMKEETRIQGPWMWGVPPKAGRPTKNGRGQVTPSSMASKPRDKMSKEELAVDNHKVHPNWVTRKNVLATGDDLVRLWASYAARCPLCEKEEWAIENWLKPIKSRVKTQEEIAKEEELVSRIRMKVASSANETASGTAQQVAGDVNGATSHTTGGVTAARHAGNHLSLTTPYMGHTTTYANYAGERATEATDWKDGTFPQRRSYPPLPTTQEMQEVAREWMGAGMPLGGAVNPGEPSGLNPLWTMATYAPQMQTRRLKDRDETLDERYAASLQKLEYDRLQRVNTCDSCEQAIERCTCY